MNQQFRKDYYRMTGAMWKGSIKDHVRVMLSQNIKYMLLYRKYREKRSLLTRLRLYRLTRKYGLEISVGADLGEGTYLGHPYNITVAEGVKTGRNVNLHKGCTIGRENRGKRQGVPVLGNNVFVGINAVIVGNITIGDDVLIAPGSFVNVDIPPHSIVIGNPCQIHRKENATEGYVNFHV